MSTELRALCEKLDALNCGYNFIRWLEQEADR